MRICPRCGKSFQDTYSYCPDCDKEGMNVQLKEGLQNFFQNHIQRNMNLNERFKNRLKKNYDKRFYYRDRKKNQFVIQKLKSSDLYFGIIGSIFFLLFFILEMLFFSISSLTYGFEMIMIIILLTSIILGVVLISVSVGFISKKANNSSILRNYIIFSVLWILGMFLTSIFLILNYHYNFVDEIIITKTYTNFGGFVYTMLIIVSGFILLFATFKINKSYENIAWYTKNKLFNITGNIFITSAFVILLVDAYNIMNINDEIADSAVTQIVGYVSYIPLLIVCILQIVAFSVVLSNNLDSPT